MAVTPLDGSLWNGTELHQDRWIVAELKTDSNNKYDYKEPVFKLPLRTATGYQEGDRTFLLFTTTTDQIGNLLTIKVKRKDDSGWKDQKEEAIKVEDAWKNAGCFIAVDVSKHNQLKTIASVLCETHTVVKGDLLIKTVPGNDGWDKLAQDLKISLEYMRDNGMPEPESDMGKLVVSLYNAKQFLTPFRSSEELPKKMEDSPFGMKETGELLCVPFVGSLPKIDNPVFTPPEKKGSGGYSRGVINVSMTSPQERLDWVKAQLEDPGFESFCKDIYAHTKLDKFMVACHLAGVPMGCYAEAFTPGYRVKEEQQEEKKSS